VDSSNKVKILCPSWMRVNNPESNLWFTEK